MTQSACPICGEPAKEAHRPFCSSRCRSIDLGRWLNEAYRIPAGPADEPDENEPDEDGADDEDRP
ncbi:hypothetical protein EDC65_0301 [Stella humosa]|uniref:DNA gyrase inhibitor YacG n=1 Tax=Stella humosa TaxID=94 RepID=A0A3N1MDE2_9PROT|nr:DNA gyrase inhibitor YacG [Stella humosa]ROQ01125.1 hypothetical protein EDC65_0301 [Stella humosa]BBK31497.1 hypothetical protein STHU_21310 [Stella humosa]